MGIESQFGADNGDGVLSTHCKELGEIVSKSSEVECGSTTATCREGSMMWMAHTSVSACLSTSEERCWLKFYQRCWLKFYEESKEMHLDSSSAANLCNTIIIAPQYGQCQTEASQGI
jgi:hypothetical protein